VSAAIDPWIVAVDAHWWKSVRFFKTPNTKFQYWDFVWVLKRSELRNRTGPAQLDLEAISKNAFRKTRDRAEIKLRRPGSVP